MKINNQDKFDEALESGRKKYDRRRKLTDEQIFVIKRLEGSIPINTIAKTYGVSHGTIKSILDPEFYEKRKAVNNKYKPKDLDKTRQQKRDYKVRRKYGTDSEINNMEIWMCYTGEKVLVLEGHSRFNFYDKSGKLRNDLRLKVALTKLNDFKEVEEWLA